MKKRLMLFSTALALLVSLTALAQDTTKPSYDNTKAAPQENQEKSASQAKTVTVAYRKATSRTSFPSPAKTARAGTCAAAPLNSPTTLATR